MKKQSRVVAVVGMASALVLIVAPGAQANWTSSITNASPNFESRRWNDQSYSQVQFTDCYLGSTIGAPDTVDVQMWRDISLSPDDSYDNKTFTACFGGGTSNGEWTELPSSSVSVYFQLMKVGGQSSSGFTSIDVDKVYVDTTKAD